MGKYGTRYGASIRKMVKKIEVQQHSRYTCPFCGKDAVKRVAVGIWHCRGCNKTTAGGAWAQTYKFLIFLRRTLTNSLISFRTTAAATVRSSIRRLREMRTQA